MDKGLVHLYWGEGKGKTTAAMGLGLRALGRRKRVTVVQFLKKGTSGELEPLRQLGAVVHSGGCGKFVSQMTLEEKQEAKRQNTAHLRDALAPPCDLLILDEACAAWQLDMVDQALLRSAVLERPKDREVVLTGREPAPWMLEAAHYSTEMRCHRHPYQEGIPAREGVEF
ncbi:MAG: cob(I)yrinic acid a,c-diamide adenosyltransferase [Oscillospiraceae bacterium]|nr:cob(I)yrinic acid a,c-diamide adenosyltransferase [Oscillospiraceae bacterium]